MRVTTPWRAVHMVWRKRLRQPGPHRWLRQALVRASQAALEKIKP